MGKLTAEFWKLGAKRMLVAVSKRAGLTNDEYLKLGPTDWEPIDLIKLNGSGPFSYETLFRRAADNDELTNVFREYHIVSPKAHETIVGKAIPVSTED